MSLTKRKTLHGILNTFLIVMFLSCQMQGQRLEKFSEQTIKPIVSTEDVEWLHTKDGQASFVLKSLLINRYGGNQPYLEFPKGLEMNSFDVVGQKDAFLRSNYAIQNLNTSIIEARGGVELKNAQGDMLETEYLIWDAKSEKIYTEEFVKITQSGRVIMGNGFVSDIYFSNYSLKKSRGVIDHHL